MVPFRLVVKRGVRPWWWWVVHPRARVAVDKWLKECEGVVWEDIRDRYERMVREGSAVIW